MKVRSIDRLLIFVKILPKSCRHALMLLNMFIVMTSEQQEVGDVSEHVTTASFKYWTTLESVSMTTQSMAAVV